MLKRKFIYLFSFVFLMCGSATTVFASHGDQNDRNCGDFNDDAEAVMDFWYTHNYSAENDPSNLDGDADGLPCEVTTDDWNAYVASQQAQDSETEETEAAEEQSTDRDCGQFENHEEVMAFWYTNGYNAENDPHDLDRDNDGLPCEISASEWEAYVADQENDGVEEGNQEEEDNENAAVVDEDDSSTEAEGDELADTATNHLAMMLLGGLLVLSGMVTIMSRKKA